MTTLITIVLIIIAIPILLDLVFDESHICVSILENFSLYNKSVEYIKQHSTLFGWILFFTCILIIYPVFFYIGYHSNKSNTSSLLNSSYIIGFENIYGHRSPNYIASNLKQQITNNDSLLIAKINDTDSIVYNRKSLTLERRVALEQCPKSYCRYENCNMFSKMILGAFVIPSWNEVKDNFSVSSNGKKFWIICSIVAGYFGYHQGYKCRSTELANESWKKWAIVQNKLNDESWWIRLSIKYPYLQKDENSIDGSGIGINFKIDGDKLLITKVLENMPAKKCGIRAGDEIVTINQENIFTKNLNPESVGSNLRGKKDTFVKLGIKREGKKEIINFNIKREVLPVRFTENLVFPIDFFE